MADWWLMFQNAMNEYFHIPPSQTIPALIGMVMIFGIFFLVLYEAFKKMMTEGSDSAAGGISALVSIAAVLYMAYAGWILALMSFGVAVLVIVGIIFFFGILLVGWHRTAARVHEAANEKWVAKKELIEAKGSANEAAREKIEDFFDDIKTMSEDYYKALRGTKEITEENAAEVNNTLGKMQTTLQKMSSITSRWIKYLRSQGYRDEFKEAVHLRNRITKSYRDIAIIRDKISKGDYKGASRLLFKLKKEEKREEGEAENAANKEEKEKKKEEENPNLKKNLNKGLTKSKLNPDINKLLYATTRNYVSKYRDNLNALDKEKNKLAQKILDYVLTKYKITLGEPDRRAKIKLIVGWINSMEDSIRETEIKRIESAGGRPPTQKVIEQEKGILTEDEARRLRAEKISFEEVLTSNNNLLNSVKKEIKKPLIENECKMGAFGSIKCKNMEGAWNDLKSTLTNLGNSINNVIEYNEGNIKSYKENWYKKELNGINVKLDFLKNQINNLNNYLSIKVKLTGSKELKKMMKEAIKRIGNILKKIEETKKIINSDLKMLKK